MNDFVKIHDFASDSLDLSKVEEVASYTRGINVKTEYSVIRNNEPIKLIVDESTGLMNLEGNFGMFWNGHNMVFPNKDFQDSVDYISDLLNNDLRQMRLVEFDHSAIVKVDMKPEYIINNHISIPGHETNPKKAGKYFKKPGLQLVKLYNATRRMKQFYSKPMRAIIFQQHGISDQDNLIRFEKKYLNPEAYFKSQLTVDDILNPSFINQLNDDLLATYKSIMKTGLIRMPKNKKDINSATIPLILAKELGLIYTFDFDNLIHQKIKEIPESLLNKEDKKARRRQIQANLKKITLDNISSYDISEVLSKSLKSP